MAAVLPQFNGGAAFTGLQQDYGAEPMQRGTAGTGNPGGAYNASPQSFQHPARAAYAAEQERRLQGRMGQRMAPPQEMKPAPTNIPSNYGGPTQTSGLQGMGGPNGPMMGAMYQNYQDQIGQALGNPALQQEQYGQGGFGPPMPQWQGMKPPQGDPMVPNPYGQRGPQQGMGNDYLKPGSGSGTTRPPYNPYQNQR